MFAAHHLDYSMLIYINRKSLPGRLMCVWAHSISQAADRKTVRLTVAVVHEAARTVEVQVPADSGIVLRTTPVEARKSRDCPANHR